MAVVVDAEADSASLYLRLVRDRMKTVVAIISHIMVLDS